jgi:hypothetical protein
VLGRSMGPVTRRRENVDVLALSKVNRLCSNRVYRSKE